MIDSDDELTYEVTTLSNGITVAYKQLNIPDIVFITRVNEGSIHEPEGKRGILHLIEHLFYRTTDGSNLKRKLFEITGRDIPDASTHPEHMVFSARMPNDDFHDFLKVWSGAVKRIDYDKSSFEPEKNVVLSEIAPFEEEGSVLKYLVNLRKTNMYPGHILGLIPAGNTAEVSRLTANDIARYKSERVNASNMVLTVVGGFDPNELKDRLEFYFGDIKPGTKSNILQENVPRLIPLEDYRRFPGLPYQILDIMYIIPGIKEEASVHLSILNEYLAGGLSGKLSHALREEKGLVYSVSIEEGSEMINPDEGSIMVERFSEQNETTIKKIIDTEISNVKEGIIDSNLLETITTGYYKTLWEAILESPMSRARQIDYRVGKGVPYSLERVAEIRRDVQPRDISRIAQRVFNGEYITVAIYPG
ncbi:insulinase family protein [Candidatus Woesearchaeota archaeon]|nr:insulinase family protein [Candidatus Woesearchaeota archaeon]